MTEGAGPDAPLIEAARRGEEWAFRTLYRRHTPRVYAVALRMLAWRRDDAEDVVQETWLRAASGLQGFRGDSAFSTWVTGIAIRCAFEAMRRHRDDGVGSGEDGAVAGAAVGTTGEARLDLERAIAALPGGYRAVLVLHDVHGYTHAEIARLLGVDEGTSKSQLSRARRAVRARLGVTAAETRR
jgi:RNA polymerase sigma factor (sigma-70 family)